MQTVKRRRLHEDIVQQFHALIREGALKHGDRLPAERELAEQFQVSRSSVREAIRSLELQGLVVSKPGAGTFISTENLNSVVALLASTFNAGADVLRDAFEMRHLLEPPIAALAAQRASPEEVARLQEILEDQQRQIDRGDTGVEADTAFHFALAAATHNSALIKVVSAVEDVLQRSRGQSLEEPGRRQRSLASHREILQRVQAGDPQGAQQAMDHHLGVVEPSGLQSIETKGESKGTKAGDPVSPSPKQLGPRNAPV